MLVHTKYVVVLLIRYLETFSKFSDTQEAMHSNCEHAYDVLTEFASALNEHDLVTK